jgi:L-iditol 2-dehydrogenase
MKALIILGPHHAEIREVETPKPVDDMLLIKVMRTGICATDQAIYTGNCSFIRDGSIKYPVRIGHEYSGIVEAIGSEVKNFRKGDRVYSDCAVTCNRCPACREKRYIDCVDIRSLGTVNTWDGCFAEYMYMPEHNVYHLPDSISYDEAALIEPLAVAYDAFTDVTIKPSDIVAVIGAGPIGMGAAWLAKNLGAGTVVMIGRNDKKLAVSKQIGVDKVINSTREDGVKTLRQMTGGRGVDMFIEASGSQEALIKAVYSTRRDGRISIISFYEKDLNNFPIDHLVLQCLNLKGTAGRFGNPQAVCEILRKSPLKLSPIITHRVKFDNCLEYFKNETKYHNDKIKVMVEFD